MQLHAWAWSVLLAAACGSGDGRVGADAGPGDADAAVAAQSCESRSGSRYRLRRLEAPGGISAVEGLWDGELEVACDPFAASDGIVRCMPQARSGEVIFTDAGCTARLGQYVPDDSLDTSYFQIYTVSADGSSYALSYHLIGDEVVYAGGETIYTGTPAECIATAAIAGSYHELGPALVLPFFDVVGLEGDHRLDIEIYEGDDGSRLCGGKTYDRDYDRTCLMLAAEDGALRCLPRYQRYDPFFADAACATPVDLAVAYSGPGSEVPVFAMTYDAQADCHAVRYKLHELGAAVEQAYYLAGEVCTPYGDQYAAYGVGPSVSPSGFVGFLPDYIAGGGRLSRGDLVSDDGLRLPSRTFHDTELDVICTFVKAGDETQRCLPARSIADAILLAQAEVYFSDAACTTEVTVGRIQAQCEGVTPAHAVAYDASGVSRSFPVTGPFFETLYVLGDTCQPVVSTSLYFALGPELEPSAFVKGERVIE